MLVQSRSISCRLCRRRKIKCDRIRPGCSQCIKDGWECDGYQAVWKEKPKPKRRDVYSPYESQWVIDLKIHHGSKSLPDPRKPRNPSEFSTQTTETPHATEEPHYSLISKHTTTPPCAIEDPRYSLTSSSLTLAQKLVGLLEEDNGLGMKIQSLGSFIFYIPSRLGHNQALDDAMECICSTYISILQPGGQGSIVDRQKYFLAIKSLRQSMFDESQALSSNVLAAAVLLSWYEILAQNLDNGWLAHIRGCANLIQARGPSKILTAFEQSLLDAEEGFVCAQSLICCTPSFLASPEWQSVLDSRQDPAYQGDWFYESLKTLHHRIARRYSILFSESDHLMRRIKAGIHTKAEISAVIKQYDLFRGEVQDEIARENLESPREDERGRWCFLMMKRGIALFQLDAQAFEMLNLLGPTFSYDGILHLETLCTNGEHTPLQQHKSPLSVVVTSLSHPNRSLSPSSRNIYAHTHALILDRLDASISHSTTEIKRYMLLMKQVDPFSVRKFAFVFQRLCMEREKRGSAHPIWGDMGAWVADFIQEHCFAGIHSGEKCSL